jgi:hypothetical protein
MPEVSGAAEPPRGDAAPESKVFLDYTQAELDRAYDQLAYAPDRDAIMARQAEHSVAAHARFTPEVMRYGDARQAHEFANALAARHAAVQLIDLPPHNHFEMPMALADPAAPLTHAALRRMGLMI